MAWRSRRTPTPFHASRCLVHGGSMGILLQWQRDLILACGWLNQLRNPRNRCGIGRLKFKFPDQECDAVTASLRIQRVRSLIKLQGLRFADDREILACPLRCQEVL